MFAWWALYDTNDVTAVILIPEIRTLDTSRARSELNVNGIYPERIAF
jgi:hypothetical protein